DDVSAAAEGRAGPGDDHHLDVVVGAAALQRRRPRVNHLEGEGVHALRSIQHDAGDAVGNGKFELAAHDDVLSCRLEGLTGVSGAPTTAWISAADSPASASTSAVCSPRRGACRRMRNGAALNDTGLRTVR